MAEQTLESGIVVRYPDGVRLTESGTRPDGLSAAPEAEEGHVTEPVMDVVAASDEFSTVTVLEFQGKADRDGLGAAESVPQRDSDEVELRLPLSPDENAVILADSGGVLHWEYPEIVEESVQRGGMGAAAETTRVAVFRSPYVPAADERQRPEGMGLFGDFLWKPVKKLVLRFAAKKTGQAVSEYLERNIREGPILYFRDTNGRVVWEPVDSFAGVWSGSGARRVLLFVHGTFSSVTGSFGGLITTDAGREFLERALDSYDAVIGYDHKTLTRRVLQNAEDLRDALDTLPDSDVTMDAIAFSRGGLVLRYLTEVLLPSHTRRFNLRKAVFVGCTNGGTKLAEPGNWKDLIDLYTNLVAGTERVIGLAGPSAATASRIAGEALRGLLSFVQYVVSEAITAEAVPGLASMDPHGTDVRRLNEQQHGQPQPQQVSYYLVEANFDHRFFDQTSLAERGLAKRLFLEFADGFIERLFSSAENDLVVDCEAMGHIDPWASDDWIQDRHEFAGDDGVYHTVYFNSSQVPQKLAAWLL
ncbi:MAG: hypothetical protein RIK87_13205 [Fuerstiella sp.]